MYSMYVTQKHVVLLHVCATPLPSPRLSTEDAIEKEPDEQHLEAESTEEESLSGRLVA